MIPVAARSASFCFMRPPRLTLTCQTFSRCSPCLALGVNTRRSDSRSSPPGYVPARERSRGRRGRPRRPSRGPVPGRPGVRPSGPCQIRAAECCLSTSRLLRTSADAKPVPSLFAQPREQRRELEFFCLSEECRAGARAQRLGCFQARARARGDAPHVANPSPDTRNVGVRIVGHGSLPKRRREGWRFPLGVSRSAAVCRGSRVELWPGR